MQPFTIPTPLKLKHPRLSHWSRWRLVQMNIVDQNEHSEEYWLCLGVVNSWLYSGRCSDVMSASVGQNSNWSGQWKESKVLQLFGLYRWKKTNSARNREKSGGISARFTPAHSGNHSRREDWRKKVWETVSSLVFGSASMECSPYYALIR